MFCLLVNGQTFGECDFFVTMSKMSKCENLINQIRSKRSNIFEIGHMRKNAQILRNICKKFQKIWYFYYPLLLQCIEKIWVNFSKNKSMWMEFSLINVQNNICSYRKSIFDVKSSSYSYFWKSLPRFFPCTVKAKGGKKINRFFGIFLKLCTYVRFQKARCVRFLFGF